MAALSHPLIAMGLSAGTCGITSVCSAHPLVIEATLRLGLDHDRPILIEATCNQVNQEGGYTGMTPEAFRGFVLGIARKVGLAPERIVLGGDHLGPNPWKHLAPSDAMAKAAAMVGAFAAAGFTKLHLDCSMGCRGEPPALHDELTAERAASLAGAAEARAADTVRPLYVIGTEVPTPGGAVAGEDEIEVTKPEAALRTFEIHRAAFEAAGIAQAFARVIAIVVQPGVEFSQAHVTAFDPGKAMALARSLEAMPGLVFEAHSTDYQSEAALGALVAQGFAILKVGPWLTFALREALYGLDAVADLLDGKPQQGRLMAAMEAAMQADPRHWRDHHGGSDRQAWLQRHFSLADRIRYYWPSEEARAAVGELLERLGDRPIPGTLLSQFCKDHPAADAKRAHEVLIGAVVRVLEIYERAVTR